MRKAEGRPSGLQIALVLLAALLLAFLAARVAAVELWGRNRPARALAIWPSHPEARVARAMEQIGSAAASGRAPPAAVLAEMRSVATAAPLRPEPFLVAGTEALSKGETARAERLLVEARRRDPRSLAARFLLADLYLRTDRIRQGLGEVSALARLVPGGLDPLAPALSAYARQPGAADELKEVLEANPRLREAVLQNLAANPDDAEVVIRIAGVQSAGRDAPAWQARLVQGLVERGEYAAAYRLWSRLNPGAAGGKPGLHNPGFSPGGAPPPFNWSYGFGNAGVAEPAGDGTLQIIFYGRENAVLASQTLVLEPGHYRLAADVGGALGTDSPLAWSISCLPGASEIAQRSLQRGASVIEFVVPPSGCPAQRLDIVGRAPELPKMVEATLGGLSLTAGRAQ